MVRNVVVQVGHHHRHNHNRSNNGKYSHRRAHPRREQQGDPEQPQHDKVTDSIRIKSVLRRNILRKVMGLDPDLRVKGESQQEAPLFRIAKSALAERARDDGKRLIERSIFISTC